MKKLITLAIFFCSLIIYSAVNAEMYKWVDDKGNITYSDTPPVKDAEAMEPPMLNAMPTVKPRAKPTAEEEETEEETTYSSLKIISPENDATIRSNSGNISISLGFKPALNIKQGHYISILLDGNVVEGKVRSASTSLSNIDRGTHTISANIKNSKGKTLASSQSITVHLHRASK